MQNAYAYWRASHPLVFISLHLYLGILIGDLFTPFQFLFFSAHFYTSLLFTTSILVLAGTQLQTKYKYANGLIASLILIIWGLLISISLLSWPNIKITCIEPYIQSCRNFVIQKINKTIHDKQANGFALALLLGIKSDMNKDLVLAYTQLGIIHIIAISGMHLEILFKNIKRLTSLLPRNKLFQPIELLLLLISVWTYTLMAFASPSIVRASVFFSLYTIGKYLGASSFTLNTIAAGILILLMFNTKGIHHIGLQLSYAAVIGIHLFYKLLYKLLPLNNPIIDFLWSNCCMSIAAQLTTFPILILHFHQIAGWVLVSNFIMVPLSNFILYALGILLLLPIQFSACALWAQLTEKYIVSFNEWVEYWFRHTQASSIQFTMQPLQIALYYIMLLYLYLWLFHKQATYLMGVLASISTFTILKLFS
jgi:competence protein ComEC